VKPIRGEPTPSEDKILASVKAAKQSDVAKGTGPRVTRKPYNDEMATSPATPETNATGDLHKALMSVGDQMPYHDKPASLATVGHALKQVALKIAPSAPDIGRSQAPEPVTKPEIGERDTSGLFGTPSPDREAV
jgi:hypothetical protein